MTLRLVPFECSPRVSQERRGSVKREGENFSPLSRSERFAFFKDVARRRESKGKEKGTARRGEINQKHLSTLVDSGRGRVGSLSLSLSRAVASHPLDNGDAPLCLLLLCLMADEMELC